jgi:hypothetical protein
MGLFVFAGPNARSKFRERVSIEVAADGNVHVLSISEPSFIMGDQGRNREHVITLWKALDQILLRPPGLSMSFTNDNRVTISGNTGPVQNASPHAQQQSADRGSFRQMRDDCENMDQVRRWWTRSRKAGAFVVGLATVIGAAAAVMALVHPSATVSQSQIVSLTSPAPGTAVSQTKVFTITGTVGHLGNDTLWLTDYNHGYSVDDEATVNANDTWKALDSNVGNPGQPLPFPMTLRVILADRGCASKLEEAMDSNGDFLAALPGGCTVAATVTVDVTTR